MDKKARIMKEKELPIKIAGMLAGKKYRCAWCGEEVKGFKDKLSAKEFRISGLCQRCQDKTFKQRSNSN